MANLSQQKRERMLAFLDRIREEHKMDEDTLIAINEIENELTAKKYGLVWEEHEEKVDLMLKEHIPVFFEDCEKEVRNHKTGGFFNFVLEGDNLHSLYLLEKTHAGKFDLIYQDPPYNTQNKEFIYDDKKIDSTDGYQHSKWLSFMARRLRLEEKILSPSGVIAISIGHQEINDLMLLCEDLFSDKQITSVVVQTSSGNAASGGFANVEEYIVFITPRGFMPNEIEDDKKAYSNPYHGMNLAGFNQTQRPNQVYPIYINGDGTVHSCGKTLQERINDGLYVGEKKDFVFDYAEGPEGTCAVWPVTQKGDACVWRLIPEQFMENWNKGYIKVLPAKNGKWNIQYLSGGVIAQIEEGGVQTIQKNPDVPSLDVIGFKTAASNIPTIWTNTKYLTAAGSKDIKNVFGTKTDFPFPKPVDLIKDIIRRVSHKEAIILDPFAGSGTTAQAVLELNQEDEGNRRFVLCTNNENGICENVTYPRLKTVITGIRPDGSKFSDGIPANFKYYRTGFIPRLTYDIQEGLLNHIREMIQLEHGIDLDNQQYVIIMDDDAADELEEKWDEYLELKGIYMSSDVLLTARQKILFENVELNIIPEYYFEAELREAGQAL